MRTRGTDKSGTRTGILFALLTWVWVLGVTGCTGEPSPPTLAMDTAQGSGVGEAIASEDWAVTLIGQPYKTETVGKGTNCGPYSAHVGCLRAAEGVWLIALVRLTNQASDLKFVPRAMLLVTDGIGREFILASRNAHADYLWEIEEDRWEPTVNQIPDNMLDSGASIEGPIIFDVPEDATGLRLQLKGSSAGIELGF